MKALNGKKVGMTQIFDEQGSALGVTVVEVVPGEESFQAGDRVKVTGVTIGKGFAGLVKRYHARRGPMTHGSKSHRIPGSISSGTTPGRVRKGKIMPGRMGGVRATVRGLKVAQVIAEKNLILLYGSVPGKTGNQVRLRKD